MEPVKRIQSLDLVVNNYSIRIGNFYGFCDEVFQQYHSAVYYFLCNASDHFCRDDRLLTSFEFLLCRFFYFGFYIALSISLLDGHYTYQQSAS